MDNKNEVMYDIFRDYSLTHSLIPVEALMPKLFKTSFILFLVESCLERYGFFYKRMLSSSFIILKRTMYITMKYKIRSVYINGMDII